LSAKPAAADSPFRVRSYRFQWPADLCASFGFEMETIILGWYVLVETQSVLMLSVFGALQYLGTLFAPMSGVLGHRIGNKRVICAMRSFYTLLACTVMTLALTGRAGARACLHLRHPAGPFPAIRSRDALRADRPDDTVERLLGATSISRTTQDSARVMGSLTGATLSAALGIGYAYLVIACLYGTSLLLSLNVAGRSVTPAGAEARDRASPAARRVTSPWRDLFDVLAYVWNTPRLLAAMWIAFLVNVSAFPFMTSLMPYVAKEIYHTARPAWAIWWRALRAARCSGPSP
jgi:hypothetical protein